MCRVVLRQTTAVVKRVEWLASGSERTGKAMGRETTEKRREIRKILDWWTQKGVQNLYIHAPDAARILKAISDFKLSGEHPEISRELLKNCGGNRKYAAFCVAAMYKTRCIYPELCLKIVKQITLHPQAQNITLHNEILANIQALHHSGSHNLAAKYISSTVHRGQQEFWGVKKALQILASFFEGYTPSETTVGWWSDTGGYLAESVLKTLEKTHNINDQILELISTCILHIPDINMETEFFRVWIDGMEAVVHQDMSGTFFRIIATQVALPAEGHVVVPYALPTACVKERLEELFVYSLASSSTRFASRALTHVLQDRAAAWEFFPSTLPALETAVFLGSTYTLPPEDSVAYLIEAGMRGLLRVDKLMWWMMSWLQDGPLNDNCLETLLVYIVSTPCVEALARQMLA